MKINVCGKCEKGSKDYNHYREVGNNPMFGYNWWRWLPTLKKSWLDSKYVYQFTWLNFWVET